MREILFKAKRESNRKWVEGYYYKENFLTGKSVQHFIRGKDDTDYVVCGETVSQYTGFQDRRSICYCEQHSVRCSGRWHNDHQHHRTGFFHNHHYSNHTGQQWYNSAGRCYAGRQSGHL